MNLRAVFRLFDSYAKSISAAAAAAVAVANTSLIATLFNYIFQRRVILCDFFVSFLVRFDKLISLRNQIMTQKCFITRKRDVYYHENLRTDQHYIVFYGALN